MGKATLALSVTVLCVLTLSVPATAAEPPADDSAVVAFVASADRKLDRTDLLTVELLKDNGYQVDVIDDDDLRAGATLPTAAVAVISSTAEADKLPASLARSGLPIMTLNPAVAHDLGMAGRSGEQKTTSKVIVMNPDVGDHPLAAGLTGSPQVTKAAQHSHNFGEVGGDAVVIATTDARPSYPTYYAYDTHSVLADGGYAPARRVAHFGTGKAPLTMTPDGERLVVAAVDWLAASSSESANDLIDLRGDWHFAAYRKYSNMFQLLPAGRSVVTWEDPELANVPDAGRFSQWENVTVPAADYSTGGLMQMVRPGYSQGGARNELSDADLFPNWSEGWFARTVEIPSGFLDNDHVTLMLGIIDDMDVVYINGTPVAASGFLGADGAPAPASNVPERGGFDQAGDFRFEKSYWEVPREYEIDSSLLHEGTNEISIRIYNNNSYGGFYDRDIALVSSDVAVRSLKDMPTERLGVDTRYRAVVDAQVAAIESEDLDAYAATLDEGYHQNEIDRTEQVATLRELFDTYDELSVTDTDAGYYWYRGAPVYSAERVISGVRDGQVVEVDADALHLQYFLNRDGITLERGNLNHTYAVDYTSALPGMNGRTLRYNVYLPPSYYTEPDREYPVVYLLHGINSTGDSFVNVDRIEDRMNEWIADGSVTEMIVVMPNSGKNSGYTDTAGGPSDTQGPWASHIYVDILNEIDSHYRTLRDADFRGLTGISMGGGGVFKIGLAHTDLYTSFASHMGAIPDLEASYSTVLESDILPSLDFYIDHGRNDQMVSPAVSQRAADYLNRIGASLEFEIRDGGHNSAFYMDGMQASMAMHSTHFRENGL